MIESNIYIHGGFDQVLPNIPTDKILCLDLNKIFNSVPALFKGLAYEFGKDIIIHTPPGGNNGHHGGQNVLSQSGGTLRSSTASNPRNSNIVE